MSENNDAESQITVRRSRWLWLVLIVSVALNLLVVGAVGGFFFRHERGFGRLHGHSLIAYTQALAWDRRRQIRDALKDDWKVIRALRRNLQQSRQAAGEVLAAGNFNEARYAAALDEVLKNQIELRRAVNRLFVKIGAAMSPAERRDYVSWSRRLRWNRRHRHRFWRHRGGDGASPDQK